MDQPPRQVRLSHWVELLNYEDGWGWRWQEIKPRSPDKTHYPTAQAATDAAIAALKLRLQEKWLLKEEEFEIIRDKLPESLMELHARATLGQDEKRRRARAKAKVPHNRPTPP